MTAILLFAVAVYETFFGSIKGPEIPSRLWSVADYGAVCDGVSVFGFWGLKSLTGRSPKIGDDIGRDAFRW